MQAHHRRMEDVVDISMDSPEGEQSSLSRAGSESCAVCHTSCHRTHTLFLPAAHTRAKESQAHPGSDYRSSSRMRNAEFRALWGESGSGSSQPGPSSADEPIRWNRVRRRSSSRAVRPPLDASAEEDDVMICPPPEEAKYQQADECGRSAFCLLLFSIVSQSLPVTTKQSGCLFIRKTYCSCVI